MLEGDTGGGALSNNTSDICMCVRVQRKKRREKISYRAFYIQRVVRASGYPMVVARAHKNGRLE